MNVGVRARFVLMIGLGLTVGLSLITLPGVLVGHQNSSALAPRTSTNSTGGNTNPGTAVTVTNGPSSNTTKTQPTPSENGLTITALSILITIMVIPALTLAFLTSTWVSRQNRKGFESESKAGTP